jgi:hypothetical protein
MLSSQFDKKYYLGIVVILFLFCFEAIAQSNSTYYKFPVVESGVYKIGEGQLSNLGFGNITDVSVFGYPGMLPQKLDSIQLSLQEIPSKIIGNEVFFFAQGPNQIIVNEDGPAYQHHYYADTLYYLIGKRISGNEITNSENQTGSPVNSENLFRIQSKKWEESNILNSGRVWYSQPLFIGQSVTFSFDLPKGSSGPSTLKVGLLAQSLTESTFRFFTDGQNIGQSSIPPIPNTTYGIKGREKTEEFTIPQSSSPTMAFRVNFQSANANGMGYLDFAILSTPYSTENIGSGIFYNLEAANHFSFSPNKTVWKIKNPFKITQENGIVSLGKGDMIAVFEPNQVKSITNFRLANTGLRTDNSAPQLLIVTHKSLFSQAQRLSSHKNQKGIKSSVVVLEDIYDSFGYGNPDLTAIRNLIANYYHETGNLENVLFFGKGTFDHKSKLGGRPNLVPTYSSRNSLNPLTTYSSDDYFGFVDWGQGQWNESNAGDEILQIGVGRIPAISISEAREMVDKIIAYENGTENLGEWKRNIAFFADDGDNNIHLIDAEVHYRYLSKNHPEYLVKKLYLDRYEQVRSGTAQSSPAAKAALKSTIEEGVLILNYIGHGNESTLAAERVFTVSDIYDWPENPLLPLFVTATCEFGRHDSPYLRSGAEELLFAVKKGAIGMLTTGRPVFSSVNFALNTAFIESVFEKDKGETRDLGEIFKITKNNSLNGPFNRNFSLLGDPSLKLAVPELTTQTDPIWDVILETETDTLRAMQQVQIKGKIIDPLTGAMLQTRNGTYNIQISDQPQSLKSLGDESSPVAFLEEVNVLFRGKGEVTSGTFIANVFIPKNIDSKVGLGNIRLFASLEQNGEEAMGAIQIPIGGTTLVNSEDKIGPKIRLGFGQDQSDGSQSFPFSNLPLTILLEDQSGINISSQVAGQDIELTLNDQAPKILNPFFKAKNNSFKEGEITTLLADLKEGKNTLTLSAWDNVGNRSEVMEEIEIKGSLELKILGHTTYPNPATESSKFRLTHNRPNETLNLELKIYSILGSEIFSMTRRYVEADFLLDEIEWNFFRSTTKYPVKGTYIYTLMLSSEKDNSSATKSGKIIIQ